MLTDVYTETIIEQIENILKQNENLLLISSDVFTDMFEENKISNILKESPQNSLVGVYKSHMIDSSQVSCKKNFYNIYRLYCMYEFSDNIHLLSNNKHYGTIFNYVDMGLLTLEEAIEVLLQ